ncbi:hypothetical protein BKA93DRAFT_146491 [Sparassis latifolia]
MRGPQREFNEEVWTRIYDPPRYNLDSVPPARFPQCVNALQPRRCIAYIVEGFRPGFLMASDVSTDNACAEPFWLAGSNIAYSMHSNSRCLDIADVYLSLVPCATLVAGVYRHSRSSALQCTRSSLWTSSQEYSIPTTCLQRSPTTFGRSCTGRSL